MKNKQELAESVALRLIGAGHQALFAGGCVRDRLRGVEPSDFDIATSATSEQVAALFEKTVPVGAAFGVVVVVEGGHSFEVATFRTEGGYKDGRRPTYVAKATAEQDASRRDFTVNGLFFDVEKKQVLDFVGGEQDLGRAVIRTIGDPDQRFQEDHLRLMRAIRFSVQLGFEIEPATWASVQRHAELIQKVSAERIRDELIKTLTSPQPARGLELLDAAGLLRFVMPEALTLKGVEQPSQYHPEGDVWVHTLLLLKQLVSPSMHLAFGALLHDIAKPATFVRAADRIRFHGHDKIGAEMSEKILRRLAFSNADSAIICSLVAEHLRFKDAQQMKQSTLKRFLSLDEFATHLELHRIDCLASHGDLTAYHYCKAKWEEFKKLPPPPLRLVTGGDLIQLGLRPGKKFSELLRAVEDAILEGEVTSKEEGLAWLKKHFDLDKL